ncbi:hypothetical protein EHE19_013085 [Ruminiclostridium herbifermentans]|uniref:Uncharacterized protein n=1 Tax=Ruminiclostridium herbifermentans TaxID=2488810 RepID=A0A7H1VKB5_9FIRM|nr:hypothetical protein EHE19_013085 [Ruminiclostridium herbifermentans]
MKKTDLNDLSFFLNKDNSEDKLAMALSCYEAAIYNIVKNSNQLDKSIIIPLFIRDINPILTYEEETGVFFITNENSNYAPVWHKYIKLITYVKERDKHAIEFLESLLDKGHMVMLQTVFQKIKYYAEYDPDFDLNSYFNGAAPHVNILLYHEADKFYYAEKIPNRINLNNFVPYQFNNQIGVIEKKDMEEACNFYLRCHILDMDKQYINENLKHEDIVSYIHAISENFVGKTLSDKGITKYYGISAFEKIIDICNAGVDIKKYKHTANWALHDKLTFDMWMIHGSRQILLEYIIREIQDVGKKENLMRLSDTLEELIFQWRHLESVLAKYTKSTRTTQLNEKIANKFRKLLALEKELNEMLINFT